MKFGGPLWHVKRGLLQAFWGMALLAGASGLLHILDHERNAVARAEQLADGRRQPARGRGRDRLEPDHGDHELADHAP